MADPARTRVPIKPGFFTVPDDPAQAPRLLGTKCLSCGEHFYPRRTICAKCLSERTVDVEMAARGSVYSYTFVHFPLFGSMNMEHADGYGVGPIDLPEGPRVQAPLAGKQEQFKVGQQVEGELNVLRSDGAQDVVIIRFRPVEVSA